MGWQKFKDYMIGYPKWFVFIYFLVLIITGCTFSIIVNNTEGTASDLVDTTQDASPNLSPEIQMP